MRRAALSIVVFAVAAGAQTPGAVKTPVILINGFELNCSNTASTVQASQDTFGQLATLLQADGIPVSFFNTCSYASDTTIEQLGVELGSYINALAVSRVDLVTHSMGGLIARAYLAGFQPGGSFVPPADPRVRKLIELGTPNFGSNLVSFLGGVKPAEMAPGSAFLLSLATWNQHQDDLRGVDALAIIGNGAPDGQSDGVVSLTSASLSFARPDARTRVVPYCHLAGLAIIGCTVPGIAAVDGPSHLTAQIVRSFLADTQDWSTIGKPPSQDPVLSQSGGVYFFAQTAAGQPISDFTQVSFGNTALTGGAIAGTVFYKESLSGSGNFSGRSTTQGSFTCGPFTIPTGRYTALRCKVAPEIFSVGPLLASTPARVVQSGGSITISGSGFGQPCNTCSVVVNPGGGALQIASWTDQSITAALPAFQGSVDIVVRAASGSDSITVLTAPPASPVQVASAVNAASFAAAPIAPGEIVSIFGSGLGPAATQSFFLDSAGKVPTTLAGTSVLIGGIPAPVTYTSANQVNAIVPYELTGLSRAVVQVSYQGNTSASIPVAVASAAPGAFISVNQDFSINGPAHPADKGSYVTIYGTGGGPTNPAGSTGSVNPLALKRISQDIAVTVGGQPATVAFAGAAPGLVDGVMQINIVLAATTPSGAQPLEIVIGGARSAGAATIAVK